ncbi:MAG: head-tail connector protein [Eubacteriales bacterium]
MILSVSELRQYVTTDEDDRLLEAKLSAIEQSIKGYTNNDFSRVISADGEYPMDIKLGVARMIKWDLSGGGDKIGVASETISRHSVTYVDQTAANTLLGYPVSLLGFLKPYKRARFGGGVGV